MMFFTSASSSSGMGSQARRAICSSIAARASRVTALPTCVATAKYPSRSKLTMAAATP